MNPTTPFEVYNAGYGEMPNLDANSKYNSETQTRSVSWQTVSGNFSFYTQRPSGCSTCISGGNCSHNIACVSACSQMALSPLGTTVPSLSSVYAVIGGNAPLSSAANYLNGFQAVKNRGNYVLKTRAGQTQTSLQWNLSDGIMSYNLIPIVGLCSRTSKGYSVNSQAHAVVVRYVMSDRSKFGLRDPWARSNSAGIVDRTPSELWEDFILAKNGSGGQFIF